MELYYSTHPRAEASRKYRLAHPEKARAERRAWTKAHPEKQLKMEAAWREANREYVREYNRLSQAILKARRAGNAAEEHALRIQRRLHCMTLCDRQTFGPMKKEV